VNDNTEMILTPKGVEVVEYFLAAGEEMLQKLGEVEPSGMAEQIQHIVGAAMSQISDIMEVESGT
jgi:hypothetical protein